MTEDPQASERDRAASFEAAGNAFRPYAGWAFYGLGAIFVLVGYLGISGESVVAKQLPYLISGGIGGILIAVLGAYLLGVEELRKDGGRLDRMEKQVEQLHQALLLRPDAPTIEPSEEAPTHSALSTNSTDDYAATNGDRVLIVKSGESFHLHTCALVTGKETKEVGRDAAASRGLKPCLVCEPIPVQA